jgi:3-oxoacyl-[acyl-carrier protein] reductase
MNSIAGKVALVTGASRGIGRSIAVMLAQEGCNVALLARNEKALEESAALCKNRGVKTLSIRQDLTETSELPTTIQKVASELGGIDILINNAGIATMQSVVNANPNEWKNLLDVNLYAVMEMTRLTVPYIIQRGGGSIIFIASISSKITYAGGAAYCASKHAITGFAGSVFEDVRHQNVKVCSICPGYVNTEMVAELGIDPATMTQPEDVSEAVRFVLKFPSSACPTEIIIQAQKSLYV